MPIVKLNVVLGGLGIVLAGFGGMALGATYGAFSPNGMYAVDISRALIKAGHTHGMPLALYNLIIGLLLPKMDMSPAMLKTVSWLAAASLIMPIGLVLRGLDNGGWTFAPLGFGGAFCFMISAGLLAWSALRNKAAV